MESQNNDTIKLIKEKLIELGDYLKSLCKNDDTNKKINDTLINLKDYEMLMFILFLDQKNIDKQIEDLLRIYGITYDTENFEYIKKYMIYFTNIKKIIDKK